MFKSEKDLVEHLIVFLQERFNTEYIVRELQSGNNIADIVYSEKLNRKSIIFDEYFNAYYYFNDIYNRKKIPLAEIKSDNKTINTKIRRFLRDLEEQGYIIIKDDYIDVVKKVDAVSKKIVAIEAKLSDWKAGLEQAYRYKNYADEVYVALSSDSIKNVDKSKFKELNIGLMSVSDNKLTISIRAKKEKVANKDVQFFMADKFLKQLQL